MIDRKCLHALAAFLLFGSSLNTYGQASSAQKSAQAPISCFQCSQPETAKCIVSSEDKEKSCPQCTQWKRVVFGVNDYAYSSGPPRANYFVNKAVTKVYGDSLPLNAEGHPISINALYADPERYGWAELNPNDPKAGSILVLPHVGGLVVGGGSGVSPGSDKEMIRLEVLYPSDKEDGRLTFGSVKSLSGGQKPKFLVPKRSLDMARAK